MLKASLRPYSEIPIIPTGGVDDSNARAYIEARAVALGVGGWLTGGTDFDVIAKRARALASVVR